MFDLVLGDLEVYPEVKQFILTNNFTNEELHVSEAQLKEAFGESELQRIRSGRNNAWSVSEVL